MTTSDESPGVARLSSNDSAASYSTKIADVWTISDVESETFSFLWTLRNYSKLSRKEPILSPVFKGPPTKNCEWQLEIMSKNTVEKKGFFGAYLQLILPGRPAGLSDTEDESGEENWEEEFRDLRVFRVERSSTVPDIRHEASCTFSLLSSEGEALFENEGNPEFILRRGQFSWGKNLLTSAELFSPENKLLEGDTLRIHCRITVGADLKHISGVRMVKEPAKDVKLRRLEHLSEDMLSLFVGTEFADLTIHAKGAETFSAHKNVLAGRSRVFRAMFASQMKESAQNSIEITDFEADVVKAMLEHIYSGQTPALREYATDLIRIAEKYDLEDLKADSEDLISTSLTVENAAELLVLAHFYNANKLKTEVMEFIKMNQEQLLKTEAFAQVAKAHSDVFVDLFLSLAK